MILKKIACLLLMISFCVFRVMAQEIKTPVEIVQDNLEKYNMRDLDGFMTSFSDSILLYSYGRSEPVAKGKEAIRELYKKLFDSSPDLNSTILHRAVIGNRVIDHESIVGRKGSSTKVEMIMIYEVNDQKITSMTVVKE